MSGEKLEAALAYGRMKWRIFPCHSIVQTAVEPGCSCGKTHKDNSAGKHPRTRRGLLEATDDEATIRRWWARWPDANIALATGSGLAVFDIDGAEGAQEFKALVAVHGAVPETLAAQTGRGYHIVFATQFGVGEVRSSARGHVHVRGEGGYIIVPPSDHISGRKYQWVNKVAVASLPDWLRQWSQGYEIAKNNASLMAVSGEFQGLGKLPPHLAKIAGKQHDITSNASESLKTIWTPAEQARLISALTAIPVKSCGYDEFLKIGFALHSLDWCRSDGTSVTFELWNSWCAQSEHHNQAGLEAKWKSFDRSARGEVSVATIYHMARQMGWDGGVPSPANSGNPAIDPPARGPAGNGMHLNGTANGVNTLPAAFGGQQAIFFPDLNDKNQPRATMLNTKVALTALNLDCRYDQFHNRMLVAGELISKWSSPELSDHVIVMVRDIIRYRFGFDPNKTNVQDACEALCLAHRFDPVLDYLDSLCWDGQPRLDMWLTAYMQAIDSPYARAVAHLSLIAAVRRARVPGTKFDQVIVLEGLQGKGKSEAIEILAGTGNFSDQSILGVDDRKQQELTEGVWLYEISELSGIRKADIEHVKAFASRKEDRARPAYGHYVVTQPRRTVFFASTNKSDYLQDDTGNRRFWPVATGNIDLAGLRRDRDQLWAEASERERRGESHFLPESLWKAAGEQQDERLTLNLLSELIEEWVNAPGKEKNNVSVVECLMDNPRILAKVREITLYDHTIAAKTLLSLGFMRYRPSAVGIRKYRYRR